MDINSWVNIVIGGIIAILVVGVYYQLRAYQTALEARLTKDNTDTLTAYAKLETQAQLIRERADMLAELTREVSRDSRNDNLTKSIDSSTAANTAVLLALTAVLSKLVAPPLPSPAAVSPSDEPHS